MATALFSNPLTAKFTDAIAPEMKSFDPAQQAVLKAEQEQERYKTFQDLTKSEEQKMLTEGTAKATETYAKEAQPKELTDELKKKVEDTSTPFIPTQQTAGDLGTIFAVTNILGFAIGRGAKGSAQAALSAQNGMLEGYQKGQMDVYKKQKDVFDENQKALSKAIEGLKYELTQAEKTASINKELAMSQVQQAISKHGADTLGKYIDQFGLPKGVEYVKSLERMDKENQDRILKNRQMAIEKERLTLEKENKNKPDYEYVVKDGKTYAVNKRDYKDIHEITGVDFTGATKLGATQKGAGGVASISQGVLKQDVDNAIYNLQTLKDVADKDGKIPGGSVAFANAFKGDLTSDIIRYATTQNVDKGLQGNDAILLNLAYDIASAQTGGRGQLSDAKVKAVVAQMPLDSEPDEVKATKWDAIIHRIESANQTLPNDKQISIPEEIKSFAGGKTKNSNKESGNDEVTGFPKKNSKGWVLHHDKNGVYAYVGPKGEVEEIE